MFTLIVKRKNTYVGTFTYILSNIYIKKVYNYTVHEFFRDVLHWKERNYLQWIYCIPLSGRMDSSTFRSFHCVCDRLTFLKFPLMTLSILELGIDSFQFLCEKWKISSINMIKSKTAELLTEEYFSTYHIYHSLKKFQQINMTIFLKLIVWRLSNNLWFLRFTIYLGLPGLISKVLQVCQEVALK